MQIGLLLGAGASSYMGLPTTKEIMADVENDLCKNHVYQCLKPQEKFVSISLFEVYFCLFVHSYNYQHDIYENKLRFASKIQLKRARKNIF